jgi:hypothetical protein
LTTSQVIIKVVVVVVVMAASWLFDELVIEVLQAEAEKTGFNQIEPVDHHCPNQGNWQPTTPKSTRTTTDGLVALVVVQSSPVPVFFQLIGPNLKTLIGLSDEHGSPTGQNFLTRTRTRIKTRTL